MKPSTIAKIAFGLAASAAFVACDDIASADLKLPDSVNNMDELGLFACSDQTAGATILVKDVKVTYQCKENNWVKITVEPASSESKDEESSASKEEKSSASKDDPKDDKSSSSKADDSDNKDNNESSSSSAPESTDNSSSSVNLQEEMQEAIEQLLDMVCPIEMGSDGKAQKTFEIDGMEIPAAFEVSESEITVTMTPPERTPCSVMLMMVKARTDLPFDASKATCNADGNLEIKTENTTEAKSTEEFVSSVEALCNLDIDPGFAVEEIK